MKLRKRNPKVATLLDDARTAGDPDLWERTARRTVRAARDVGTAVVLAAPARLVANKPRRPPRRVWKDLSRTIDVAMRQAVCEFVALTGPTRTETGYVNANDQENLGSTGAPGHHNQTVYELRCRPRGNTYEANGAVREVVCKSRWFRRIPECCRVAMR